MISIRLHKKNTLILLVILYHGLGQHKKAKTYCAISKCFMYLEVYINRAKSHLPLSKMNTHILTPISLRFIEKR